MTIISSKNSNVQLQLLDNQRNQIDYHDSNWIANSNYANIDVSSFFGKGKLWSCYFNNLGTEDLICSASHNTINIFMNFIDSYSISNFLDSPILTITQFSSLVIPKQQSLKCNMMVIPIISKNSNNSNDTLYCKFKSINESGNDFINILPNFNLTIQGSIGKKFDVIVDNTTDNSKITITPDATIISDLEVDEYLIVYFEINQPIDGKQIVILEENEQPNSEIIKNINGYDNNPINDNAHKILDNGNIFLRYRPKQDTEQGSYYILCFKSLDPITVIAYQRDNRGLVSYEGTATTPSEIIITADLNFIYADENQVQQTEIVTVQAQSELDRLTTPAPPPIISIPSEPSLKYCDVGSLICPNKDDRLGRPLSFNK